VLGAVAMAAVANPYAALAAQKVGRSPAVWQGCADPRRLERALRYLSRALELGLNSQSLALNASFDILGGHEQFQHMILRQTDVTPRKAVPLLDPVEGIPPL